MKKMLFLLVGLSMTSNLLWAQKKAPVALSAATIATIRPYEDSLKMLFADLSEKSIRDTLGRIYYRKPEDNKARYEISQQIARMLVKALKTENSFYYPFDSIKNYISIVEPSDQSFKIFSWPIINITGTFENANETYEYYGAMQINAPELKLVGLKDKSASMASPQMQSCAPDNWYGCLYYGSTIKEFDGKKYYFLFGWDGNTTRSNRKIADVVTFEGDKPTFGSPVFNVYDDVANTFKMQHRFFLEYRKSATVNLRYESEQDLIIYDHLSNDDEKEQGFTQKHSEMMPDGMYYGFRYENGVWKEVGQVLREYMQSAPVVKPVLGEGRNADKAQKSGIKKTKKGKKKHN